MRDLRHLRQRGDNRPVAGLQTFAGVANPHAFLMAILVQQGKRIQIQRVALGSFRQFFQRPTVQARHPLRRPTTAAREEARERRLTRDRFDPEHLGHRRIVRQMCDPRQLVRPAQDAADEPKRGVARIIGVRARRRMRQHRPQLLAQTPLGDKPRPHR
jgi:hypothetical protein